MNSTKRIMEILCQAKRLAREYRHLTGKPLGVTGEVAEYEAARILALQLNDARNPGSDADEVVNGKRKRLQIKGRCILQNSKPSQMVPSINIGKGFDAVLLVLLDHEYNATEIWELSRRTVIALLKAPGSRARNERNAMSVSKFRAKGRLRWSLDDGLR